MGSPRRSFLVYTLHFLVLLQAKVLLCYQFKVGDLDAWGIPTPSNPNLYTKWANTHLLKFGDSLLFLYPPTQDSVIQVTQDSYRSCNIKDPILQMNDGNSLFNITSAGDFYFISGEPGHCLKGQKLLISMSANGSSVASSPSAAMSDTADGPSYANAFGSIPTASSGSSVMPDFSASLGLMIGLWIWVFFF